MPINFTQLYLHEIWGTWDILPLVTGEIKNIIYNAIAQQYRELGCTLIAIGVVADHVHILTGYPPNLTISELMGKAKVSSSHLITYDFIMQWSYIQV